MNLGELDNLLAKWQKDLQTATSNLVAFEESPAYKAAKTILPSLEGKTKQAMAPALAGIESVWELLAQLTSQIKEATRLRQSMPLAFGRSDRINQIENLLVGHTVELQVKEIPLEERGLTGARHLVKWVTLNEVFTLMQSRFLEASKAVNLYDKAYEELFQKITQLESDLQTKFGGDSTDLTDVKNVLHTDPVTGLELVSQIKKKKRKPPADPLPVISPIPSAGGSLHDFLSKSETNSFKLESLEFVSDPASKEAIPAKNESDDLSRLFHSKEKIPVSNAPKQTEPLLSSIEELLTSNKPPVTPSLENLFTDRPATSEKPPTNTLENLFGS